MVGLCVCLQTCVHVLSSALAGVDFCYTNTCDSEILDRKGLSWLTLWGFGPWPFRRVAFRFVAKHGGRLWQSRVVQHTSRMYQEHRSQLS